MCVEGAGLSLKLTYFTAGQEGPAPHLESFASPFPALSSGNLHSPALWAKGPQLKVCGWPTQGFMRYLEFCKICAIFLEETACPILAPTKNK